MTSYSPCLMRAHTRHGLLAIVLATGTLIDIILAASYPLSFSLPAPSLTLYSPRPTRYRSRRQHPHCHPTRHLVLYNFPLSVTLRAALTMSQSSQSYSPHPTCYRPRRILLAIVFAASYSLLYSSHRTRSHTHCVLLAIVHAAGVLIAILLIVVMLIASCSSCSAHRVVLFTLGSSCHVLFANFPLFPTLRAMLRVSKTAAMDVTLGACAGNAKCGSSIYRCTLDIKNRTGLSHYAWNLLRVCECDASICCDVLCLDIQRNHGAMTRVIRMPFALTRLHPEGKYPDTAASRRKMPDTAASRRKMP